MTDQTTAMRVSRPSTDQTTAMLVSRPVANRTTARREFLERREFSVKDADYEALQTKFQDIPGTFGGHSGDIRGTFVGHLNGLPGTFR